MSGNTVITDGATNWTAEVDSERRLRTLSTTISFGTAAAIRELQYIVGPPILTLTSDSEAAIVYAQNLDPDGRSWAISSIDVYVGIAADATDECWTLNFFINDNDGNITTSGTPFPATPLNTGSTKPLAGNLRFGGDGFSFSSSNFAQTLRCGTPLQTVIPLDSVIVPAGNSVGLSITPPAGTTNLPVDASFTVTLLEEDF